MVISVFSMVVCNNNRELYKKEKEENNDITCNAIILLLLGAANCMSIWQLYNSYELDLLTKTRRLSIYNIARTYVYRKQTLWVCAHFNVCAYVKELRRQRT